MDFLDHLCEKYKINSSGTSWEYFRQYKQLYARKVGQYVDINDSKEIQKVSRNLRIPNSPRANTLSCSGTIPNSSSNTASGNLIRLTTSKWPIGTISSSS